MIIDAEHFGMLHDRHSQDWIDSNPAAGANVKSKGDSLFRGWPDSNRAHNGFACRLSTDEITPGSIIRQHQPGTCNVWRGQELDKDLSLAWSDSHLSSKASISALAFSNTSPLGFAPARRVRPPGGSAPS